MKQTAVEWLTFHWLELDKKYYAGEIGRIDYRNRREAIQSEAKEMEKQQIIDAFEKGYENGACVNDGESIYHGGNYYNKTFKQQEQ